MCRRWKWTFSFIVSWYFTFMAYHWSSASFQASSTSSSTSIASSISSQGIVPRNLIILREIILWLHMLLYYGWVVLYWDGTWLNYGTYYPVIISSCTLYVSDVISLINSIVIQSLSSWPTDLKKLKYELLSIVWYFYIIGQ
jgi:hypothetical protein